jgi:hypothetical protein
MTNPVGIAGTRRQRVVTQAGVTLERQTVYLPPETWEALQRICVANRQGGSQLIQNLIELADRGTRKDNKNAHSATKA